MVIHEITEKDYRNLHKLYEQLIEAPCDYDKMLTVLKEIQGDSHYQLFGVFDDADELVGTATLTKCLDLTGDARYYYNLENFVVEEKYRRKGCGRFLMQAVEKYVESENGAYINFTSSASREAAHKFYEQLGYPIDYVKGFKKRFEK